MSYRTIKDFGVCVLRFSVAVSHSVWVILPSKPIEASRALSYYNIQCSRTNLIRIEESKTAPRGDILAGLGIIYEVTVDSIVYC